MATNYSIIKESEKELSKHFFVFYNHVYRSWKKLDDLLTKNMKINDFDLEDFFKLEKQSNEYEAELLDECIWNISSNQPMASHLRYLISIIYSISDLERMADYVIANAKFINSHKIDTKIIQLLKEAIHASLVIMNKIVQQLKNKDNIKKHWITTYRKTIQYKNEFTTVYSEIIKKMSSILFHQKRSKEITEILNGSLLVLKNNERNIDHAINLVENFIYIRNFDFFHNKLTKQIDSSFQTKLESAISSIELSSEKSSLIPKSSKNSIKKKEQR